MLSRIELVNSIVALLSIDFHALEQDVKKEQQLKQKVCIFLINCCESGSGGSVINWRPESVSFRNSEFQIRTGSLEFKQCSGSGIRCLFDPLDPGSGMGKKSESGMKNSDRIFESLETIFLVKIFQLFGADPGPGIEKFGSRMGKNSDPR